MLAFSVTNTRADGMTKTTPYSIPNPHLCCPKSTGSPTASSFRLSSYCCRATSALSVVGGIVSIALIENSNQSNPVKTAVCIAAGLLVLSSYYCYRFGSSYVVASEHFPDLNQRSDNFDPV